MAERSEKSWHGFFWLGVGLFVLGVVGTPIVGYLDLEANFSMSPRDDGHALVILLAGSVATLAGAVLCVFSLARLRALSSRTFVSTLVFFLILAAGAVALYAFLFLVVK